MSKMTGDMEMSAAEILNEVRRQQWEMNNARYKPDATLFISGDCWITLLKELSRESGAILSTVPAPPRCLMGYTTIVVRDVEQYIELKENTGYGGRTGVTLGFDECGYLNKEGV